MNRGKMIPYGRQWIDEDDIAAVVEVLRGDWLTQGPMVQRFEAALANYCGANHAVAVNSGTMALHIACLASGLGSGDEGITSPITFMASANCVVYCGARPVFADIDSQTWNIDPAEVEKKITDKTKVIIPVHFGGLPCDMVEIRNIADQYGLMVIEDACHAIGAEYHGRKVGATGTADMVCFSFHPVKHITSGEGGAVVTNNDELAEKLRMLRHHGVTKNPDLMGQNDGPWYYEAIELGYNGRITDMQCALGLSQLGKLDCFLARRRVISERYRTELADVTGLQFQAEPEDRSNAYHLMVAHFDPSCHDRRIIFNKLRERGIAAQVHYVPVHRQPAIRHAAGDQGTFDNAERYYNGCLSLPMFPALTDEQLGYVISTLKEIL